MEDAAIGQRCRARWRVVGRVQGVGFRWFVVRVARRFGLSGSVCNLPDGSVEVWAEGSREGRDALLEQLRRGPRGARVESVEALQHEPGPAAFEGFDIRR